MGALPTKYVWDKSPKTSCKADSAHCKEREFTKLEKEECQSKMTRKNNRNNHLPQGFLRFINFLREMPYRFTIRSPMCITIEKKIQPPVKRSLKRPTKFKNNRGLIMGPKSRNMQFLTHPVETFSTTLHALNLTVSENSKSKQFLSYDNNEVVPCSSNIHILPWQPLLLLRSKTTR